MGWIPFFSRKRLEPTPEVIGRLLQEIMTRFVERGVERCALGRYDSQDFRAEMMRYVLDRVDYSKFTNKDIVKLTKLVRKEFSKLQE